MDCSRIGILIKKLRTEQQMTQRELADKLNLSDKTISKWERGLGCPDISLLGDLSDILMVNAEDILKGDLSPKDFIGGNMKNSEFYVCSKCGNIIVSTAEAQVSCCGRKLTAQKAKKAEESEKLSISPVEDEWFITSEHPMTKDNYISFVALLTGDSAKIYKQYPEWSLSLRIKKRSHGKLLWFDTVKGLFYQLI